MKSYRQQTGCNGRPESGSIHKKPLVHFRLHAAMSCSYSWIPVTAVVAELYSLFLSRKTGMAALPKYAQPFVLIGKLQPCHVFHLFSSWDFLNKYGNQTCPDCRVGKKTTVGSEQVKTKKSPWKFLKPHI